MRALRPRPPLLLTRRPKSSPTRSAGNPAAPPIRLPSPDMSPDPTPHPHLRRRPPVHPPPPQPQPMRQMKTQKRPPVSRKRLYYHPAPAPIYKTTQNPKSRLSAVPPSSRSRSPLSALRSPPLFSSPKVSVSTPPLATQRSIASLVSFCQRSAAMATPRAAATHSSGSSNSPCLLRA